MIGHEAAETAFLEAYASGRLHHAWLLAGPQSMGKAEFARRVAQFLLSRAAAEPSGETSLDDPGDSAATALFASKNHPELLTLKRELKPNSKDLARNVTVDQVRAVLGRMHQSIGIGHWRVIIVDAIDDLEAGAANALLKTLEEPPRRTLFLLVSHSPGRLLPTIRSRCRTLRFQPLDRDVMLSWLRQKMPLKDEGDRVAIAEASQGIPGAALDLAETDLASVEGALRMILTHGDPDNRLREALAQSLARAASRPKYEAMLSAAPAILADMARHQPVEQLGALMAHWDALQRTIRDALRGSYDPAMTSFEVGSIFNEAGRAVTGTTKGR